MAEAESFTSSRCLCRIMKVRTELIDEEELEMKCHMSYSRITESSALTAPRGAITLSSHPVM